MPKALDLRILIHATKMVTQILLLWNIRDGQKVFCTLQDWQMQMKKSTQCDKQTHYIQHRSVRFEWLLSCLDLDIKRWAHVRIFCIFWMFDYILILYQNWNRFPYHDYHILSFYIKTNLLNQYKRTRFVETLRKSHQVTT